MRQKAQTFAMIFRAINPLVSRDLQNVSNVAVVANMEYVM